MGIEMQEAIADLAVVTTKLGVLAQDSGPDRRRDLIQLRRELGTVLEAVARAADTDVDCFSTPDRLAEALPRISSVRHTVALHQGSWSAVLIETDQDAYRKSAEEALNALRGLVTWLKASTRSRHI